MTESKRMPFNSGLKILAMCQMNIDFLLSLGQKLYPLVTDDVKYLLQNWIFPGIPTEIESYR